MSVITLASPMKAMLIKVSKVTSFFIVFSYG